ncbi:cyanophycinase [Pedobacter montanisoli]|uniref:Cyanophycinase n=1 Tax=Pedobacter montanisoli TaxID=2923277 RepID=A0ABS9ZWF7_9SPHI|nr:cyanophycinase [Pedobacter montanisoli]MCJ0742645.1 cyanophycinase [Pedobacter montanisoli]
MRRILVAFLLLLCGVAYGCGKSEENKPDTKPGNGNNGIGNVKRRPASIGIIGDTANVNKAVTGGMVLMGGGTDVSAAFKWMIEKSGGGDVVILRASGTDAYNSYINGLGNVNSVETLLINSRELANNDTVAYIIRNAEMVFIAGGDQSDYMKYWKGTKVDKALNYLLTEKKAPVGGTSAGCAILGAFYYSGETGGLTSAEALENPYNANVTLYKQDFLKAPYLENVITDQHYLTRSREGRSAVFLGRILKDWNIAANAIAADERVAVCIDQNGVAKVYGDYSTSRPYSYAYFIRLDKNKQPENFVPNNKVNWSQQEKALDVYEIAASENGGGEFDVKNFAIDQAKGGTRYWWWVSNGILHKKAQ